MLILWSHINVSPGTGQWYISRTATGRDGRCIFRSTYSIYIHIFLISLLETMDINTKMLFSLQKLRMNNMQRASAVAIAAVLSKCGFNLHHVKVWPKKTHTNIVFFSKCMFRHGVVRVFVSFCVLVFVRAILSWCP